ncbi:MAG TPA: hypothetical protein VGP42_16545 [Stellaceae bacterium]|jgi:hypothetical protein|nr:hypothetical protein [Stellaceae bacterium]
MIENAAKTSCAIVPLRPANPTALEKAVFAATDAWFLSERAKDAAYASAEKYQKKFLKERDEHRKECGRQLALAQKLHRETKINIPWKEWAPAQTGWSYRTVARRMKDFVEPDAPKERDQVRAQTGRGGPRIERPGHNPANDKRVIDEDGNTILIMHEQRRTFDDHLYDWLHRETGRSYQTGEPGRPTSSPLIEQEMRRRAEAGELLSRFSREAAYLSAWLGRAHPAAPPMSPKTIQNKLAPLHQNLLSPPDNK